MNQKLLFLALIAPCGIALAQADAHVATAAPMPDGSRDTYLGLGLQSAPRWAGADSRRVSVLPVLQAQWSSGVFVSGMSLGLHLSSNPTLEFGPLLVLQPGRGEAGIGRGPDGVGPGASFVVEIEPRPFDAGRSAVDSGRLAGLDDIHTRLLAGGFANFYVSPQWRLTSSLLAGSGNDRDGARLEFGVQRLAAAVGEHHRLALSAGVVVANRNENQAWFGVTPAQASRSRFNSYAAGGGLQDAHLGLRWNWDWSPSWMLTTNLQAQRLLGGARHSPLVERPTNLTVSSAVAYRF